MSTILTMEPNGAVVVKGYPPDSTEKEIRRLCNWAFGENFPKSRYFAEEIDGKEWVVAPRIRED